MTRIHRQEADRLTTQFATIARQWPTPESFAELFEGIDRLGTSKALNQINQRLDEVKAGPIAVQRAMREIVAAVSSRLKELGAGEMRLTALRRLASPKWASVGNSTPKTIAADMETLQKSFGQPPKSEALRELLRGTNEQTPDKDLVELWEQAMAMADHAKGRAIQPGFLPIPAQPSRAQAADRRIPGAASAPVRKIKA